MIYQTDRRLPEALQKYGGAFTSLAWYREKFHGRPWTAEGLAAAWAGAIAAGIISGDLNHDGDLSDPGEASILDWGALAHFLECRLQYLGKFEHGAKEAVGAFCVVAWTNPANGFTHFVVGSSRPVTFDPIFPGSITVRDGHLNPLGKDGSGGIRVFRKLP